MNLPYLVAVELCPEDQQYPAATLYTDDFDQPVLGILFSGKGSFALAQEVAKCCNAYKEEAP